MKYIKYFIQFFFIILSFGFFKILGPNISSKLSGKLFEFIGPFFRSRKTIETNIRKAFPNIDTVSLKKIKVMMWNNYGRVFAEYMFIKNFRVGNLSSNIDCEGADIINKIKNDYDFGLNVYGINKLNLQNYKIFNFHLGSEIGKNTVNPVSRL